MINKVQINRIFTTIAPIYDKLNDLMSCYMHKKWKQDACDILINKPTELILDLAAGTGDITLLLSKQLQPNSHIVLADLNSDMLAIAANRITGTKTKNNITIVQADAENLPFTTKTFDAVIISFGLRNFTNKGQALQNVYQVLKSNGILIILDMSKPTKFLYKAVYFLGLFTLVPLLGLLCGKPRSYSYLCTSIYKHSSQQQLQLMLENNGYQHCWYHNISGGIVSLHVGYRE